MTIDILLPLIILPIVVVGGFVLYRRVLSRMEAESEQPAVSGTRLTSEHLRRLDSPPWRVVFEIGSDKLGEVDHVVVGPPGVIAITTVLADRPADDVSVDPMLLAAAAGMRGGVDDLARGVGMACDLLAKVFWGAAQETEPAAFDIAHGTVAVEGQRLNDWLAALPERGLTASQIDLAWQAIVTGIGRPDPLA